VIRLKMLAGWCRDYFLQEFITKTMPCLGCDQYAYVDCRVCM